MTKDQSGPRNNNKRNIIRNFLFFFFFKEMNEHFSWQTNEEEQATQGLSESNWNPNDESGTTFVFKFGNETTNGR